MEDCIDAVQHKVNPHMVEILSSEYSADEVQTVLFQILAYCWGDVTNAMLHFLNSDMMDPEDNYTHIVLIPKIKSPKKCLTIDTLVYAMSYIKLSQKFWPID